MALEMDTHHGAADLTVPEKDVDSGAGDISAKRDANKAPEETVQAQQSRPENILPVQKQIEQQQSGRHSTPPPEQPSSQPQPISEKPAEVPQAEQRVKTPPPKRTPPQKTVLPSPSAQEQQSLLEKKLLMMKMLQSSTPQKGGTSATTSSALMQNLDQALVLHESSAARTVSAIALSRGWFYCSVDREREESRLPSRLRRRLERCRHE